MRCSWPSPSVRLNRHGLGWQGSGPSSRMRDRTSSGPHGTPQPAAHRIAIATAECAIMALASEHSRSRAAAEDTCGLRHPALPTRAGRRQMVLGRLGCRGADRDAEAGMPGVFRRPGRLGPRRPRRAGHPLPVRRSGRHQPDRGALGHPDESRMRSFLATAAKHGICFFGALVMLTEGRP
jgi:hypothetical protein